jgi:hypothetical protein
MTQHDDHHRHPRRPRRCRSLKEKNEAAKKSQHDRYGRATYQVTPIPTTRPSEPPFRSLGAMGEDGADI